MGKYFGVEKLASFVELIKDTICIKSTGMMEHVLDVDSTVDHFVKLTEEHRRDRQRRLDAGDETALLKFNKPAPPPNKPPAQGTQGRGTSAQPSYNTSSSVIRPGNNYRATSSNGSQKRPYTATAGYQPPAKKQTYGSYSGGGNYSGSYRR